MVIRCFYCSRFAGHRHLQLSGESIEEACPIFYNHSHPRVSIRSYLKEITKEEKIRQLQYLVRKILPLLKLIHQEQELEKETEAAIQGLRLQGGEEDSFEYVSKERSYLHGEEPQNARRMKTKSTDLKSYSLNEENLALECESDSRGRVSCPRKKMQGCGSCLWI
ncbi:hypothetical protein AMTR_s00029p00050060 [Amborella trichopoda]|uniref:Uncharacterized protein n=1 Tax=Amborella trichopoda TaxID=13333 RepID=W1PMX4_AMBTC|nr:hypothetical protein AMTR_s00029p00050060 [Amborella trichopoda]